MDAAKQKHDEQMLERYTGLNIGQLETLLDATRPEVQKIPSARRKAMSGLIDQNQWITPRGRELLKFAERLGENDYYLGPREAISADNWIPIAKRANAELPNLRADWPTWNKAWFHHAHLRVMADLYNMGCVSLRWLNKLYGGYTVNELEQAGMVQFDHPVWPIYSLTPAGMDKLQEWGLI